MLSRRKLIKGLTGTGIVSGALPLLWSEPIVKSVVLPAHATTSAPSVVQEVGLYISLVLPNGLGADGSGADECAPDEREFVAITNSGSMSVDLSGHVLQRDSDSLVIASLSGSIAAGETIELDVCDGDIPRLSNDGGGEVSLTGPDGLIDVVSYPSTPNGPIEGTTYLYGPTPSTTTPRPPDGTIPPPSP